MHQIKNRDVVYIAIILLLICAVVYVLFAHHSSSAPKSGYTSLNDQMEELIKTQTVLEHTAAPVAEPTAVPTVGPTVEPTTDAASNGTTDNQNTSASGASTSLLINLNTATNEQLQLLPGIGPSKAQAIANYRKEKGLFKKVEDLKNVKGIGEKTFAKLRPYISVSTP